jgi:hypothetical protein
VPRARKKSKHLSGFRGNLVSFGDDDNIAHQQDKGGVNGLDPVSISGKKIQTGADP